MATVPAVNISESPEEYQIDLAAPGLNKEDFKVSVERDMLNISTQVSDEHKQTGKVYNRREYSFTAFTRSFALPESTDVDRIEASYTNGVLKLSLPKKEEAKAVSKQIEIS